MKLTKLLLAFLVCSCSLVHGQTYQSVFGEDSTHWDIYHEVADGGFTLPIKTIGDTLFNGVTYKLIYDDWSGEEAFLREDSVHSKLYYYSTLLQQEYLIMNLDWNQGDTVFPYNPNISSFTVIDTVFTNNGLKHLRTNVPLIQWPTFGLLEFIES